ncbi:hypothetical protein [Methanobrevibacter sp. UBA212]|uniref:hypothetical protein n=1 Tax=Methanobrevibacter sp. UBA212 TaxID=1915476 RepID=UPI0025FC64FC|nr:hypothetical protein [Methanobrevibacter sp. UBA212]
MTEYEGYSFEYHPKFKKEFNKIINRNRCPTLKEDFKLLLDALILSLNEHQRFPRHVCMHIAGLDENVSCPAFIVKKFRCKNINRGVNSGFRITFLFDSKEKKFIFVEFFNKSAKKVEDKNRINRLFKKSIKIQNELFEGEEDFLNSY